MGNTIYKTKQHDPLKLAASQISPFSGKAEEWHLWRARTECALTGSGFEKILKSEVFARANIDKNAIVYAQLVIATIGGTAHHLISQNGIDKDGHGVWESLTRWYQGDVMTQNVAEEKRCLLETITLHSNTTASSYINKFFVAHHELSLIPNEAYTVGHVVNLFLKYILDPDYYQTVEFLNNSNVTTLDECIAAVRKAEVSLLRKRSEQKRLRNTLLRMVISGDIEGQKTSASGNSNRAFSERRDVTEKKDGEYLPTKRGFLAFSPIEWKELDQGVKSFVQKYNEAVRAGRDTSNISAPSNVTIRKRSRRVHNEDSTPTTDGDDQKDSKKTKTQGSTERKAITINLGDEQENR